MLSPTAVYSTRRHGIRIQRKTSSDVWLQMDFMMQPPGLFSQKEAETRSYHSQLIRHVDSVSLPCPGSTLSSKDTGCTLGPRCWWRGGSGVTASLGRSSPPS